MPAPATAIDRPGPWRSKAGWSGVAWIAGAADRAAAKHREMPVKERTVFIFILPEKLEE
jgi:hypothetical protein